jgi:hypothetical protein
MIKLALVSTKGGVGKTTLAANLGALLADMGLRVLLIDADEKPSLSKYFPLRHPGPPWPHPGHHPGPGDPGGHHPHRPAATGRLSGHRGVRQPGDQSLGLALQPHRPGGAPEAGPALAGRGGPLRLRHPGRPRRSRCPGGRGGPGRRSAHLAGAARCAERLGVHGWHPAHAGAPGCLQRHRRRAGAHEGGHQLPAPLQQFPAGGRHHPRELPPRPGPGDHAGHRDTRRQRLPGGGHRAGAGASLRPATRRCLAQCLRGDASARLGVDPLPAGVYAGQETSHVR